MKDELHSLEFELRRLRPRKPSEFFEARLEAALEQATEKRIRPGASWWLRGAGGLGFAAAIAWLAAWVPGAGSTRDLVFRPVAAEETLQSASHEGLVTLDDGSPAQRVRLRFVETVNWSDGGRRLTWTVPREELRIVPIATY